ncbi:hypothetical protein PsAD2_03499 [Pseudovibrio axinellae]|uniref:Uncharacterized protein n=1 Tax=Pseudovibrio axinellae TaxID=989403 RepID=A0A165W8D7_9HYPH|nr:hypothetical protein PsAD2_03499 [Pseudovibrio axinellae]
MAEGSAKANEVSASEPAVKVKVLETSVSASLFGSDPVTLALARSF